jgi:hypothetical protein
VFNRGESFARVGVEVVDDPASWRRRRSTGTASTRSSSAFKQFVNNTSTEACWAARAPDPNDADALAGSAYVYFADYLYGSGDPRTDYEAKLLGQAERAIGLARDNVRAYFVKADYLNNSRRHREGLAAAEASLAINPNFALLLAQRAIADNSLG